MRIVSLATLLLGACVAWASNGTDSLSRGHRVLNGVEVVGVKRSVVGPSTAVTDIDSVEIERYNISSLKDVGVIAPNFYMPDYGSEMTSAIYVRGLGSRMDQPVIGLSVDNVPVMNKDAFDARMSDLEKIEVLRGAQSVLSGRNSMGGQVNVTTLSPWHYEGVKWDVTYGRFEEFYSSVGAYRRINDRWAASVSVSAGSNGGEFVNAHNGTAVGKRSSAAVRVKVGWRPSAWASVMNVASVGNGRQSGYPYEMLGGKGVNYNDTCYYKRTTFVDGLTAVWAGKRVVVTSTTSVQYVNDDMTLDQDFTPADYFTLSQRRKEWAFTEDLFAKGRRGDLSWLGGVFAFSKFGTMSAPVTFFDTGIAELIEKHRNEANDRYPISWDGRSFLLGSDFRQKNKGTAVYVECGYRYGSFLFQLGCRYDSEWVELDFDSHCNTGYSTFERTDDGVLKPFSHTPVKINDSGRLRQHFQEVLPKLSVSFKTGAVKTYMNITKAYKAGGFNTQMFSDVLQQRLMQYMDMPAAYDIDATVAYKPEISWNFELGANYSASDGTVNAGAVLFKTLCSDQQVTVFPPGLTTGRMMTNAASSHIWGAEITADVKLCNSLGLSCAYGFTKAKFHRFSSWDSDYSGRRVPYVPANTLFCAADWSLPFKVLGHAPVLNVNFRGVGDIYWNEANTVRQHFYGLLGGSLTFVLKKANLQLWGHNLTNTCYDSFYFVSMKKEFVQRGHPWSMGATLRLGF